MAESQSRYSIIQELVDRKQSLDADVQKLESEIRQRELGHKRAEEETALLKIELGEMRKYVARAKVELDKAIDAIQAISKDSEK